jgi:hypothetical protein
MRLFIRAGAIGLFLASTTVGQTTAVDWTKGQSGSWTEAAAWSGGIVPVDGEPAGAAYDVTLGPAGGPYTVDLATPVTVTDLSLTTSLATLQLSSGGSLQVTDGLDLGSGSLVLNGGTLTNTQVTGGQLSAGASGSTSTLSNVGLHTTLNVGTNRRIVVTDGLDLTRGTIKFTVSESYSWQPAAAGRPDDRRRGGMAGPEQDPHGNRRPRGAGGDDAVRLRDRIHRKHVELRP